MSYFKKNRLARNPSESPEGRQLLHPIHSGSSPSSSRGPSPHCRGVANASVLDLASDAAQLAVEHADNAQTSANNAGLAYRSCRKSRDTLGVRKGLEKRMYESWIPSMTFVLFLNIAAWISTGCQAHFLKDHDTHPLAYHAWGWVPFVGALVAFIIFASVWKWYRKVLKPIFILHESIDNNQANGEAAAGEEADGQEAEGKKPEYVVSLKYILAVINAILCLAAVIGYFQHWGIDAYFQSTWQYKIDYADTYMPPAFAYVSGKDYGDKALASFAGSYVNCTFPKYMDKKKVGEPGNDCPALAFNNTPIPLNINSGTYSTLGAHIFDPYGLRSNQSEYEDLSSRLVLQIEMNFSSADINSTYGTELKISPYVFGAIYDKRLDLAKAVRCGLVALTEIPAMGSTTFTMSVENITDTLGLVAPPDNDTECLDYYKTVLAYDPPYKACRFNMASMPVSDLSACDTSVTRGGKCISQVILRYGTRAVSGTTSVRGKDEVGILLDEGALVGAVQFFMWFLGMYIL